MAAFRYEARIFGVADFAPADREAVGDAHFMDRPFGAAFLAAGAAHLEASGRHHHHFRAEIGAIGKVRSGARAFS
jgi:hypothetical protein